MDYMIAKIKSPEQSPPKLAISINSQGSTLETVVLLAPFRRNSTPTWISGMSTWTTTPSQGLFPTKSATYPTSSDSTWAPTISRGPYPLNSLMITCPIWKNCTWTTMCWQGWCRRITDRVHWWSFGWTTTSWRGRCPPLRKESFRNCVSSILCITMRSLRAI